jgi:proton-translocating NAD(P)+ transhydrogenase subunit alpha
VSSVLPTLLAAAAETGSGAEDNIVTNLGILVLAGFVGYAVISKVPNTLHTPLMSGTNAIHGIVVLGGLLLVGIADGTVTKILLVIAIAFGTINVVGGFLVTDRMLEMFKGRKPKPEAAADEVKGPQS